MNGGNTVFAHGRHVAAGHNGIVHAGMRGQALGEHGLAGARRAAHQNVAVEAPVRPSVPRCDRNFAQTSLELGLWRKEGDYLHIANAFTNRNRSFLTSIPRESLYYSLIAYIWFRLVLQPLHVIQ